VSSKEASSKNIRNNLELHFCHNCQRWNRAMIKFVTKFNRVEFICMKCLQWRKFKMNAETFYTEFIYFKEDDEVFDFIRKMGS
jgi:hypothetical protein